MPGVRGHPWDVPCRLLVARNSLKFVAQQFDSAPRLHTRQDAQKVNVRCSNRVIATASQSDRTVFQFLNICTVCAESLRFWKYCSSLVRRVLKCDVCIASARRHLCGDRIATKSFRLQRSQGFSACFHVVRNAVQRSNTNVHGTISTYDFPMEFSHLSCIQTSLFEKLKKLVVRYSMNQCWTSNALHHFWLLFGHDMRKERIVQTVGTCGSLNNELTTASAVSVSHLISPRFSEYFDIWNMSKIFCKLW